jgi:hypothetical protein
MLSGKLHEIGKTCARNPRAFGSFVRLLRTGRVPVGELVLLLAGCLASGCATTRFTDTTRSAFEQELMAKAVEAAAEPLPLGVVADSKIFLDSSHLGSRTDRDYIQYVIRKRLAEQGALVLDEPDEAEYIVLLGVGTSGTNRFDSLIGLPSSPVGGGFFPVGVQLPEIAIHKNVRQQGVCRIRVAIIDTKTGFLVDELDSGWATSEHTFTWLLGIGPRESGRLYFR